MRSTNEETNQLAMMQNVERGVRLLDEKRAGWWNGTGDVHVGDHVIDVATLDMRMNDRCILGQVHRSRHGVASYTRESYALGLNGLHAAERHGFTLVRTELWPWSFLQEVWVAVIASRRFPERTRTVAPDWIRDLNRDAGIPGWA